VLLDENVEAQKHSFYIVQGLDVSPNHELLGYGVDTVGGEKYALHVKDIKTGKMLLAKPIPVCALFFFFFSFFFNFLNFHFHRTQL
jgi:oligopeptidase B